MNNIRNNRGILFLIVATIYCLCSQAQTCRDIDHFGWFVPVKFCQPFVAEMESPLSRVEEGFGAAKKEYMVFNKDNRKVSPYLNVTVGTYIPIWSAELRKGWFLAVDIPIAFHLWLDLKSISAPVINTDYRFAVGEVKLLKMFNNHKYLKNLSIRFAPYNHESTHIGDELTILRKEAGYPITRVNVSYEYTELAVCLNDPDGTRKDNQGLKVGAMIRNNGPRSWFKIYANECDTVFNRTMKNIFEFYVNYEWQRSSGWGVNENMINVLSFEYRNRARYRYPSVNYDKDKNEYYMFDSKHSRANCYNLYWGWKFLPKDSHYINSVGLYLHGYYGIVPYGQFRNTGGYGYFGFSIVIDNF